MTDLQELLKAIPVKDIAKQIGVEPEVAEAAVKQVLPTLVGGMAANAKDEKGAASLAKAISAHKGGPAAPTSVAEIDTDDGEKIVRCTGIRHMKHFTLPTRAGLLRNARPPARRRPAWHRRPPPP